MEPDLDSLLDDALDDFDAPAESFVASPSKDATEAKPASILSNSSSSSSSADSKTVFPGLPEPGTEDEAKMMKEFTEMMSQLAGSGGAAGGGGDESMKGFTNFLQQMTKGEDFQRILQAEQAAAKQNEAPVPHPPLMAASKPSPASETIPGEKIGQGEAKKTPPAEGGSKGEAVNEAVKMISEGFKNASEDVGGGDNPFAALGLGGDGEGGEGMDKMLAQLMKSMGEEGSAGEGGEGLDKMVEDMMKSMMSKENFFEPISEICSKYPAWIEKNKPGMEASKLLEYQNQHKCFLKMLAVFEANRPDESQAIMDLMSELQNYGQPPPEIVQNLLPPGMAGGGGPPMAPGGMPQLPPMDSETMKEIANECPTQ